MKTPEVIQNDIKRVNEQLSTAAKNSQTTNLSALRKEKANYEFLILYLKTNPTEEQIQKQLVSVQTKIKILSERFDAWLKNNSQNFKSRFAALAYYDKINDLPRLKAQIASLEYLLS
jgi:predicted O-linked N-acetylglucosamine transferase (SPINDLY family)